MRTALEKSQVNPANIEQRDQVENAIVRQERKAEISAGQFQFHTPVEMVEECDEARETLLVP
jgi:hypothetical protein